MAVKRFFWGMALAAGLLGAPVAAAAAPSAIEAIEVGPAFRGGHPAVLGLDGAFSAPLPNGRSLWIFGDTLIGRWKPDGTRQIDKMPNNTAAITGPGEWATGFSGARFVGAPDQVLTLPGAKHRPVWPLDLAMVKGKPWLYYVEIAPFGTGPLDFKVVGSGLAAGRLDPSRFERPQQLWPGEAPGFGASVLSWKGQFYVYAGGDKTHVARVAPERIAEAAAYSYWDGKGWARDWRQAVALPGSGPEVSVRYNAYLGQFVMFYVGSWGRAVMARFADAPEGPWSEARKVIDCQPGDLPEAMFYGAKQHAELDAEGGRVVVVTYNTNGPGKLLEQRPDLYWPRVVRVTFTR